MSNHPALVWLPVDHRNLAEEGQILPFFVLGDKYARAVRDSAACQPVLYPLADPAHVESLLATVDGVMLTGSPSNVHPRHFNQELADPALPLDPRRDHLTLELVRSCLRLGVPLLGICRGLQEINVALGGSLHQQVHKVSGLDDHREPAEWNLDEQYGPRHEIRLGADSALRRWAGADRIQVNSLHGQGISRLAQGLRAVAHGPDGLIEAFEMEDATAFALAVQWHPEWRCDENPFYLSIFQAFGDACRMRQAQRTAWGATLVDDKQRDLPDDRPEQAHAPPGVE